MRKISKNFKSHLEKSLTTVANCWSITLKDARQFSFTDHSHDILYDGLVYQSGHTISVSSIESSVSLSADNFEIAAILNSDVIQKNDILNGKFDKAHVEYFIVNYSDISQGRVLINSGYIAEIRVVDNKFYAEIRSISSELNKQTRQIYSETCRARFKDKKCAANDSEHVLCGFITAVISDLIIETDLSITYPGIYNNSRLKIVDGARDEFIIIHKALDNKIYLQKQSKIILTKGMNIILFPECDKRFMTCCNVFRNSLNFRGEPFVPGLDEVNKTAGTFK
jgi:uncharacterized phage protein (TIGR02218 family)